MTTEATTEATEETTEATEETTEATTEEAVQVKVGDQLIANSDFAEGIGTWMMYLNGGEGTETVTNGELVVDVTKVGELDYSVQTYVDGFALEQGCVYKMSFDVKSDIAREIEWRIQINGGDYHAYVGATDTPVTTEYTTIEYEFTMEEASDPAPRLCFNMGNHVGAEPGCAPHKIYFDNVSLTLVDDSGKVGSAAEVVTSDINLNQIGYKPGDEKIAIFRGDNPSKKFNVVDVNTGDVVYTGTIDDKYKNETADETNYYGDFSSVTDPGLYKIVTKKMGESFPFAIGEAVFDNPYEDIVHMLYMQRCGTELTEEDADVFAHPACHTAKAKIYGTESYIDVTGGWHDAGDYGRYVVPGAKTVADLLLTIADNEVENSDEILEETKYELDWMFKMQDSSGGVYHKVTCANFPGSVMPEEETEELIVAPISNTATGDFAAVMAMASISYEETDAKYAKKCLAASKKAYEYLVANLDAAGFKNPTDIATGEYGDDDCKDEYFWAAAQLYKATNEQVYLDVITETVAANAYSGLGWSEVGAYGLYAYLTTDEAMASSTNLYPDALANFLAIADGYVDAALDDGYRVSVGDTYEWGSNMTVANNGMLLLMANKLSPKDRYLETAKAHFDYLCGANANSYCFITGYGTLSPISTHHRPSQAMGETMPGMLVGGPDSNLEDPYAQAVLVGVPAPKCYVDNSQSYSCNEVTIYWNSPLIYLMSGVE